MAKDGKTQAHAICPKCGKGKLSVKAGKQDLGPLLGLERVIVTNLAAPVCNACGAVLVPGDFLGIVSLSIAGSMLTQAELEPMEVRFLRKLLEYTQADLAEHLGVDRATSNRWEQEGNLLTGANSYALRSHVFVQLRDKAGQLFTEAEKALKEHPAPRPKVPAYRRLDAARLKAA
jgi:DNA-binding XRE family transcriptional regulator